MSDDLRSYASRLARVLNDIADLQEDAKQIKAEVKAEGFDMKAFAQVVKEQRRGADYQAAQLELELVLDTYRKALDLPTTLEQAQAAVLAGAETLPNADDDADDVTTSIEIDGKFVPVDLKKAARRLKERVQ